MHEPFPVRKSFREFVDWWWYEDGGRRLVVGRSDPVGRRADVAWLRRFASYSREQDTVDLLEEAARDRELIETRQSRFHGPDVVDDLLDVAITEVTRASASNRSDKLA